MAKHRPAYRRIIRRERMITAYQVCIGGGIGAVFNAVLLILIAMLDQLAPGLVPTYVVMTVAVMSVIGSLLCMAGAATHLVLDTTL